ncbi:Hypothetical protein A7982_07795 [Minicystis rosea]|nr:Hypothetical protein A7982_07795 [Minicystis rosea]
MTAASEAPAPSPIADLALGAAYLVGVAAAVLIVERIFPSASLGTALIGALVVDVAASRYGVRWGLVATEGEGPEQTMPLRLALRRAGVGAGLALASGIVVLLVARALGWIHGHGSLHPSFGIVFALIRAIAVAVRDEMLYRGIPILAAQRAGIPAPASRVFAALAGGAAIALYPGVSLAAIALSIGSGFLFASLWQKEGGSFAAVGAHAAWLLLFGSLIHGGLFEVDFTVGNIAVGHGSTGAPAWLASGLCIVAALVLPRIPWPGKGKASS